MAGSPQNGDSAAAIAFFNNISPFPTTTLTMNARNLLLALAWGACIGACSTGPGGTSNGHPGTGGTSGSCTNVTACGGTVVGKWTVTSSCLAVTGQLDLSAIGAPCSPAVTGTLHVSGTWTADANTTTMDETTTTGDMQFSLPASCQVISSTRVTCDGMAQTIKAVVGYA